MVNGNYILYGDRPPSDSEHTENNNVRTRTAERKAKRKPYRTVNDLQESLKAQVDNDTDSIKYERKVKEPRLLRYVPSSNIEENFVNDKFETYDMKPAEEPPRRYTYAKKPKNPADGSVNYGYSRSSSACSSPNGNLPTISEHGEQYNTFRIRSPPSPTNEIINGYENKLDKYFSRPREVKKFMAKGSHPDSLYRVPNADMSREGKVVRAVRMLRWPAALIAVCVALALFVYFLVPDMNAMDDDLMNSTYWSNTAGAHLQSPPDATRLKEAREEAGSIPVTTPSGTKTSEIDFYEADIDLKSNQLPPIIENIPDTNDNRKLPIPPVYPSHIVPEVQYGNERADTDKSRSPKLLSGQPDKQPEDSTLKPHITQKPEKPLAIYFKDGTGITTTSTETIVKAETSNNFLSSEKSTTPRESINQNIRNYTTAHKDDNKTLNVIKNYEHKVETPKTITNSQPIKPNVYITSGHSKLFGISIEDAETLKSTTQSSVYNTRVSPTLPVWRDGDDITTKYPVNFRAEEGDVQPQCNSPQLSLCRGVLPYDLTSAPAASSGKDIISLLPQIEYLLSKNCSVRLRQFACVLLEPECIPLPLIPRLPCYDLCRAVTDGCEVPHELQPLLQCGQYPKTNCIKARSPCFDQELPCGDGSCVPRDWICDGKRDCPAGEDEATCVVCSQDEFRCPTGGCILNRWLCDGYEDCPKGEDELESICQRVQREKSDLPSEIGEESAGSAPAPSVRKPNRLPQYLRHTDRVGGDESSRELLMTSDSGNPYRRNYTRRPPISRLTPYKKPVLNDYRQGRKTSESDNPQNENKELKNDIKSGASKKEDDTTAMKTMKHESGEELNLGDISFFNEFENKMQAGKASDDNEPIQKKIDDITYGRAPGPPANAPITRLDKTLNKFETVIDGGEILRKIDQKEAIRDALEPIGADEDESYEPLVSKIPGSHLTNDTLITAHASPCPTGELRCVDGRCITLQQLCDGTIDCTDHADEDNCYT